MEHYLDKGTRGPLPLALPCGIVCVIIISIRFVKVSCVTLAIRGRSDIQNAIARKCVEAGKEELYLDSQVGRK